MIVGIPTGDGKIDSSILLTWDEMDLPTSRKLVISQSSYIDANRNDMIQYALSGQLDKAIGGPFTHFLMWDSDSIPVDVDTVRALFDADKDIVYAVAACKEAISLWLVYDWTYKEQGRHVWKLIADPWEPYDIFPKYKDKVFEADVGGTGMCLIKREVLEKVPPPWYRSYYNDFGEAVGDDVAFHIKIQDYGFKTHIHGGKFCRHRVGRHYWPDVIALAASASCTFDVPKMIQEKKESGEMVRLEHLKKIGGESKK